MRGTEFLPVNREEMIQRGWYYYDFLVVTADAYMGKTLTVRGLVDRFDGEYQIKVFSVKDITVQ